MFSALTEGRHPGALETDSLQGPCLGPHPQPLLPQLGHLHFADMDAHILQPSAGPGPDEVWLLLSTPLDHHGPCCQCWRLGGRLYGSSRHERNQGSQDHAIGESSSLIGAVVCAPSTHGSFQMILVLDGLVNPCCFEPLWLQR